MVSLIHPKLRPFASRTLATHAHQHIHTPHPHIPSPLLSATNAAPPAPHPRLSRSFTLQTHHNAKDNEIEQHQLQGSTLCLPSVAGIVDRRSAPSALRRQARVVGAEGLLVSGEGSAHPKLFVKKVNSVEENIAILTRHIQSKELSIDHALAKVPPPPCSPLLHSSSYLSSLSF